MLNSVNLMSKDRISPRTKFDMKKVVAYNVWFLKL